MFLRNFSKPVKPAELHSPPGVVTLVLQGLARGLQVPFWSSDECFLTQLLLFLLALALTSFTGVLHVLFQVSHSWIERGLSFLFIPGFVAKALGLLCSSVCRLHCTGRPNASTIADPGYRSVSSLQKTFAVTRVLKAGTWRKHTTFLLNCMRILVHRSLETFLLGFVVPASALVFTLAVRPDIPSLLGLMTEVDAFVFSPALHRFPLKCPCNSWIFVSPLLLAPSCPGLVREMGGGSWLSRTSLYV